MKDNCGCRSETPQNRRLNSPQFAAVAGLAGAPRGSGGDRRMLSRSTGGDAAVVRLEGVVMIRDLHRQGLSVSEIARLSGLDRKTVRRYIERGLEPPAYGPRKPRPRLLDPFTGYLRRVNAYPGLTGARLL